MGEPQQLKDAHLVQPNFAVCHPRVEHWTPFVTASAAEGGRPEIEIAYQHVVASSRNVEMKDFRISLLS